jgi:thiamine-phosphate pyrophosphorylase
MKEATDESILEAGKAIRDLCNEYEVMFILNDRPDLAQKLSADGVHLGDEDVSIEKARSIVGPSMTIGASCYGSMDRAMRMGAEGADYVAFGAFYDTKTKIPKGRPDPDILTRWVEQSTLPCVAIGGIRPENCAPIVKAGADFIAIVSYVWEHTEGPASAIENLYEAIKASLDR